MNMGREYAGEDPAIGPWRDIQIEITGSAARVQMILPMTGSSRPRKSYSRRGIIRRWNVLRNCSCNR